MKDKDSQNKEYPRFFKCKRSDNVIFIRIENSKDLGVYYFVNGIRGKSYVVNLESCLSQPNHHEEIERSEVMLMI